VPARGQRGRFSDEPGQVSYLAENPETAWREVSGHWPPGMADPAAHVVVDIDVDLESVLDFTDEAVQREWGITFAELVQPPPDYEPCQQLARRLRAKGIVAIWTYSAADQPDGRVLVVFLENLKPPSALRIAGVRPVVVVEPER
jgi:hypothetical protein